MTEPRTEAGRVLLIALGRPWQPGSVSFEGMVEHMRPAILAIEAEAATPPVEGLDEPEAARARMSLAALRKSLLDLFATNEGDVATLNEIADRIEYEAATHSPPAEGLAAAAREVVEHWTGQHILAGHCAMQEHLDNMAALVGLPTSWSQEVPSDPPNR